MTNLVNYIKKFGRMGALLLVATSAFAADADRMSAWSAQHANPVQMRPGLGVAAGQAQIEQALLTLVPPPYQIQLADTIDRTTVLQWGASNDWLSGLREAVEPHGLTVIPDWNKNVLTVARSRVKTSYNNSQGQARTVVASVASAAANASPLDGQDVAAPGRVAATNVAALAAPAATPQIWAVQPSDGSLSRALMRWSREAKVQIAYEAPSDLAAVSVSYSGDFWTALEGVLADTANGGYPLHGCQYNNLTRILHISQPCDR